MSDIIKGTKSRGLSFTIAKEADPNLSVGSVHWMEGKEVDFLRPMFRLPLRVVERTENEHSVDYRLER